MPPPARILPVLEKTKSAYKLWHEYHITLSKTQRYSLGNRIDQLFIENIEAIATAAFLNKTEKLAWVRLAIRKLDIVKVLLQILWETKSLDNKKYTTLSEQLNEAGRMLGGWHGQLTKQNSPSVMPGEK